MTADLYTLAARNHRQYVEREAKRPRSIGGLAIIELAEDVRTDGTTGNWSALTHKWPAPKPPVSRYGADAAAFYERMDAAFAAAVKAVKR